jgi:hypothetical protein
MIATPSLACQNFGGAKRSDLGFCRKTDVNALAAALIRSAMTCDIKKLILF